jgi:uncharacterized protein YcbK (DUF882 family)
MRVSPLSRAGTSSAAAALLALASSVALADPADAPKHGEQAASPARPATTTATHRAANARPPPARYRSYVERWHTIAPDMHTTLDEHGRAKLVLVSLNTSDRVELSPLSERGGFVASDLDRAARTLREPHSGNAHPVEPRLLDLVYRIQTQFSAPEIRVISAYRTPHGHNESNHGHGRAIDLIVPGASDADVAKFARELGFVGVGIYPTSGFVHVDVRDRSYFWVDASAPGHRNRERWILRDLAAKSDAAATARGERGLAAFAIGDDVDEALKAWQSLPQSPAEPDADDDDDSTDG